MKELHTARLGCSSVVECWPGMSGPGRDSHIIKNPAN